MTVFASIRELLRQQNIVFREAHHEPTRTSEESARARGEELRIGGKALLIKVDAEFRLFVLSADRKLDSGAIRTHFRAKKTRFASPEELMELTGLVPGSVPPFGAPILPFPLYVDPSVFENPRVAFNAGSLTDSIVLGIDDYRRLANPEVFTFAIPL
jgi:prolyl-tRNA editing enzyme YbaK/EbsC (Cys-tRNA(Pro) deacylase)